jgi:nucleotide-binding universal stress UspA family protein
VFPFRNILFPDDAANAPVAFQYATAFAQHGHGHVVSLNVQDAKEIEQAAIDHEIDLITVALRDRKLLTRAFGSSLAEDIIAESPCAVLAIRPPQKDFVNGQSEIQLKCMLLATNFRPSSVAATQLATQMANAFGAELHTVYVMRSYAQESMEHLSRGGGATHIAEGRPYQEIVKLADTLQADLIVIGTAVHGSLFGSSHVLGSEVEGVIRNAPCPVLCVPAARVLTPLPALVTQIVPQT